MDRENLYKDALIKLFEDILGTLQIDIVCIGDTLEQIQQGKPFTGNLEFACDYNSWIKGREAEIASAYETGFFRGDMTHTNFMLSDSQMLLNINGVIVKIKFIKRKEAFMEHPDTVNLNLSERGFIAVKIPNGMQAYKQYLKQEALDRLLDQPRLKRERKEAEAKGEAYFKELQNSPITL